jgi:hypothetical protein
MQNSIIEYIKSRNWHSNTFESDQLSKNVGDYLSYLETLVHDQPEVAFQNFKAQFNTIINILDTTPELKPGYCQKQLSDFVSLLDSNEKMTLEQAEKLDKLESIKEHFNEIHISIGENIGVLAEFALFYFKDIEKNEAFVEIAKEYMPRNHWLHSKKMGMVAFAIDKEFLSFRDSAVTPFSNPFDRSFYYTDEDILNEQFEQAKKLYLRFEGRLKRQFKNKILSEIDQFIQDTKTDRYISQTRGNLNYNKLDKLEIFNSFLVKFNTIVCEESDDLNAGIQKPMQNILDDISPESDIDNDFGDLYNEDVPSYQTFDEIFTDYNWIKYLNALSECEPKLIEVKNKEFYFVGNKKTQRGCVGYWFKYLKNKGFIHQSINRDELAYVLTQNIRNFSINGSSIDNRSETYRRTFEKQLIELIK